MLWVHELYILKNLNQFLEIGLLSFIPSPFSCIGLTLGTPLFPFPADYQRQYNSVVQTFSLFRPSSNPIPSRQKEACLMFFSYLISMSRISVLRLSRRSELSFGVFLFFRRGPVDQSPNWLGSVNLCLLFNAVCQSSDLGLIVIQAQNLDVLEETAGVFSAGGACMLMNKTGAYQFSWAPSPVRSVFMVLGWNNITPHSSRERRIFVRSCSRPIILYNQCVFGISSLWMEEKQHFAFVMSLKYR